MVIASSTGYVEVATDGLADGAMVQLQPWGRIEGYVPGVDVRSMHHEVMFIFHNTYANNDGIWVDPFSGFRAKPDSTGHYMLPMVPPGRHAVQEMIPSNGGWSNGRKVEIEVRSGQTVQAMFPANAAPNTAGNQVR